MANFDHSRSIDLRKSKQKQENQVYSTETWMPELVTFDIVADPGFSGTYMEHIDANVQVTKNYMEHIDENIRSVKSYNEYFAEYIQNKR